MRATNVRRSVTAPRRILVKAALTVEIPQPQRLRHSQPSMAPLLEGVR